MLDIAADEAASIADVAADEADCMADVAASDAAVVTEAAGSTTISAGVAAAAGSVVTGAGAGAGTMGSSFFPHAAKEMAVAREAIKTAVLMVLLGNWFGKFLNVAAMKTGRTPQLEIHDVDVGQRA